MTINEVPLNTVATITMGLSPKGKTYNCDGDGMPLLNGPTEFGVIYPDCTLYTTDSKRQCKKGDLIFCVRGSTTGRMNWADKEYALGRGVCSIRGDSSFDTKYIKYCIDFKLDALLMNAGGGTFPNLRKNDIEEFNIPFSASRRKIASILSAYDYLIENNLKRIKILEEMAQMIYREWFVKFRFPGHEKVKMVKSELGMIPEGWEVKPYDEVANFINGYAFKPSDWSTSGRPIIKISELKNGITITTPYYNRNDLPSKYFVEDADILFSWSADIDVYIWGYGKAYLNQHLFNVKSLNPIYKIFLFFSIKSNINEFRSKSLGTTMKHIKKSALHEVKLSVPPENIVKEFDLIVSSLIWSVIFLKRKNSLLRQTRDLLLPKLISGELDVEGLDIAVD